MLENCDVIANFPICGQFEAIWKPDSGRVFCKTYIFINSSFLSQKTEYRTKKSLTQLWHYCSALSKGSVFTKKRWFFTKNGDISKIKKVLVLKGIFSETIYAWALTCQIWSF